MSEYAILIYDNETPYATFSPAQWQEVFEAHSRFAGQVVAKGGTLLGQRALQPTRTATSIRGGVVTDGPFVDTTEPFCGYYLIEAADMDQAVDIAKLCPARFGGVEVRPIMKTDQS
ncbi:MAG: YciI family protein [Chloroflexota bacterium]|nr:YciI family protein [Chloroflexota bacterium]